MSQRHGVIHIVSEFNRIEHACLESLYGRQGRPGRRKGVTSSYLGLTSVFVD